MSSSPEMADLTTGASEPVAGVPPAPLVEGVFCPDCGYDLRGSTSTRCSECGFALDVLRTAASQIPWSYRHELGWFRAYWKTVWLVLRRPKRFCSEMVRPVSYADSQRFRWITFFHACVPVVVGAPVWVLTDSIARTKLISGGWWLLAGALAWFVLALAVLPGLASHFFQCRKLSVEQQNRAIALSYYAWAPLAAVPLGLLPLAAALFLDPLLGFGGPVTDVQRLLGIVMLPVGLVGAYGMLHLFVRQIAHETSLRRFLRMLLLWGLSLGVVLVLALIPLGVFYVAIMIESLR